jgi:murein DD-endopeptidase MepM/ murein hydrolase activator NlpD
VAVIALISVLSYTSASDSKKTEKPQTQTEDANVKKDDVVKEPEPPEIPVTQTEDAPQEAPEKKPEVTVKAKPYIMPAEGKITVSFSLTEPVYSKTLDDWRIHDGIDIEADIGSEVVAVNDGAVEEIRADDLFGVTVVIKDTDGKRSVYSNLEDSVELEEGQLISQGDIVGRVGESAVYEISDGPHLHFEMSDNGQKIDPTDILTK